MSETALPFDTTVEEVVVERDNRRLLAILAGVAALALLAFFVIIPALTGGDDDPVAVRRPIRRAPVASASPSPSPGRAVPITATFNDTVGRDPFRPLYTAPVVGGGGAPGPGGVVAPGTGGAPGAPGTGGTAAPGTGGTGGTDGTGGTGGSSTSVGGNRVSLLDVFVRGGATYAQTRVGSTVYTPAVGATFAGSFQLLTASGECATFLYGDEQFRLCEGQEVLK